MNKVSLSSVSCVFPITETHYFHPLACKICKKKIVLDLQITSLLLPPLAFFLLFIYLFIYFIFFLIYFWLCWVFVSVHGLSLVRLSGGYCLFAGRAI